MLVIGILSAIALPQYQVMAYKTKIMRWIPIANAIKQAQIVYFNSNGYYADDPTSLDVSLPEGCTVSLQELSNTKAYISCPGDLQLILYRAYNSGAIFINQRACLGTKNAQCSSLQIPYDSDSWRCVAGIAPNQTAGNTVYDFGVRVCKALGGTSNDNITFTLK